MLVARLRTGHYTAGGWRRFYYRSGVVEIVFIVEVRVLSGALGSSDSLYGRDYLDLINGWDMSIVGQRRGGHPILVV